MKIKPFTLILLTLSLILMVSHACKKKEYNCPPPGEDYVDSNHYWLFRHHVGDSLTFNVYRVETIDSHHVYHFLREEIFVGVDSGEVVEYDDYHAVQHEDGCWVNQYNRHNLCITFKSDRDVLKYMIYAFGNPFDNLRVLFKGKDFTLFDFDFNHPKYEGYIVNGKIYNDVLEFKGFTGYSYYSFDYIDSTYAFMNYNDGLLKFIVNDTLAYLIK